MAVNPTGDSIVFTTDIIDISDYFDLDLEVLLGNQLSDSINIYYQVDNDSRKRFEVNGAVALNNNILSTQNIMNASTVKILSLIHI